MKTRSPCQGPNLRTVPFSLQMCLIWDITLTRCQRLKSMPFLRENFTDTSTGLGQCKCPIAKKVSEISVRKFGFMQNTQRTYYSVRWQPLFRVAFLGLRASVQTWKSIALELPSGSQQPWCAYQRTDA